MPPSANLGDRSAFDHHRWQSLIQRPPFTDFGVGWLERTAVLVDVVRHHALAVVDPGMADIKSERRLMVDAAKRDWSSGAVEGKVDEDCDKLLAVGRSGLSDTAYQRLARARFYQIHH